MVVGQEVTATSETGIMPRRIAIVGGGISGLGAAWALHHHPDRFDFRLFEAQEQIGGNAITADMPQDDGSAIPFDISVTACIPSVYHHILLLMEKFGIELIDTRFSYSVKYGGQVYAHDFDSDIRRQLQFEIAKFQRVLRCLQWFGWLSRSQSKLLNALNPFNYISMGTVLNLGGFSGDFRYKVLKPMFINFLMATNVFDMPAALFTRYLEFFDNETATPDLPPQNRSRSCARIRAGAKGVGMARKRYAAEEIIGKLREAEVVLAQGESVAQVARRLGVAEPTYYRWRREYGGLRVDQAKRLKALERENSRLKRLVADQALANAMVRDVAAGNFCARPSGAGRHPPARTSTRCRSGGPARSPARRGRHSAPCPGRPRMSRR